MILIVGGVLLICLCLLEDKIVDIKNKVDKIENLLDKR
jgi:hypothetical protein